MKHAQTQELRVVANDISVTLMSVFKAVAPAVAGILYFFRLLWQEIDYFTP